MDNNNDDKEPSSMALLILEGIHKAVDKALDEHRKLGRDVSDVQYRNKQNKQ